MDDEVKGIMPTPTASNFAYLNDGQKPKIADPSRREKKAVLFMHKED